jgi:hypothetical protein
VRADQARQALAPARAWKEAKRFTGALRAATAGITRTLQVMS